MPRLPLLAVTLAAAFAFTSAGPVALAGGPEDGNGPAAGHDKPSFPMKADDFRARVEKRIERALARLDRALAKHPVPPEVEQQIRADAATAAANVRAAVDKAAADGDVTQEEAKEVRGVAKAAVRDARAKYAQYLPEKEKRGRKHGKGKRGQRRG